MLKKKRRRLNFRGLGPDPTKWSWGEKEIALRLILSRLLHPKSQKARQFAYTTLLVDLLNQMEREGRCQDETSVYAHLKTYTVKHIGRLTRRSLWRPSTIYFNEKTEVSLPLKRILTVGLLIKLLWRKHSKKELPVTVDACVAYMDDNYKGSFLFYGNVKDVKECWNSRNGMRNAQLCAAFCDFLQLRNFERFDDTVWAELREQLPHFLASAMGYQSFLLTETMPNGRALMRREKLLRLTRYNLPPVTILSQLPLAYRPEASADKLTRRPVGAPDKK